MRCVAPSSTVKRCARTGAVMPAQAATASSKKFDRRQNTAEHNDHAAETDGHITPQYLDLGFQLCAQCRELGTQSRNILFSVRPVSQYITLHQRNPLLIEKHSAFAFWGRMG